MKIKNVMVTKFFFALIAAVTLFSNRAMAQDAQVTTDSNKFETTEGQASRGEVFDPRSGSLSFEIPLVSIPGPNGMSIGAWASFNKISYANNGLGYWSLEVPKLIAPDAYTGLCNNGIGYAPTLILPGQAPKIFFLNQGGPISRTEAQGMSADKWILKCMTSASAENIHMVNTHIDYLVRSPAGVTYRFYHQPAVSIGGMHVFPNSNKQVNSNGYIMDIVGRPILSWPQV